MARLAVVVVRKTVRTVEAASEQQIRELREQFLEVDFVEVVAGELAVAILQRID
jgi:hypothetical protein